jgi:ribosomal protein S18 acetylase RimI-like enzyme
MKLQIEPATLDDLPQLADLLAELFALEPYFTPDRAKQLRGLRLIIERPEAGCILVVREGPKILGMVNLLYTVSTAEGGPAILMEDFIVRAERRGGGLGTQLLEHALQLARARGATRITLLTDGNNAGGIRFYQRHGFTLSSMVPMRLHLPANEPSTTTSPVPSPRNRAKKSSG